MTALPTIYITKYNRLTHNDLGGGGYLLWHSIVNDI